MNITVIMTIVFGLMLVTNILTEVLKAVTWNKIPTNILVVAIAEILTIAAGVTYAQLSSIPITWYYIFAAVILGLFVSYAAMFGFDKLRQAMEQFTSMKTDK